MIRNSQIKNNIFNIKVFIFIIMLCVFCLIMWDNTFNAVINLFEKIVLHREVLDKDIVRISLFQIWIYIALLIIVAFLVYYKLKYSLAFLIYIIGSFCMANYFYVVNGGFRGFASNWDFSDRSISIITGYGDYYGTNYPPLAVGIYKFLNIFTNNSSYPEYVINYFNYMASIIAIVIIFYCLTELVDNNNEVIILIISIILSGPFLFAIQRGNIILLALALTFVFITHYDSEIPGKRILAIICLALAANIKYYPALFGILLIKDKRWKESIATVIAGVGLFIAPALIILIGTGENLLSILNAIANSTKSFVDGNNILNMVSFKGVIYRIIIVFRKSNLEDINGNVINMMFLIWIIISAILIIICKRREYMTLLISILCIQIPTVSYWYTPIFLVLPLILLVISKEYTQIGKVIFLELILIFGYIYINIRIIFESPYLLAILWCTVAWAILKEKIIDLKLKERGV